MYDFEKQHKRGKLHAIERIQCLMDPDSFREIQSGVKNQQNCFGIKAGTIPYDGVITGYGYINGQRVFVYSQDFTIIGGTLGKQHGMKIVHVIKMAVENRCPIIGIVDSGGARIQEGVNSLSGYGDIFYYMTLASGYVPQISIIAGSCAGGAAYAPGLSDFIFVIDQISNLCVTGPKVIQAVTGEAVTTERLGGAKTHSTKSGVAHFRYSSEKECYLGVRKLLDYIPNAYHEKRQFVEKKEKEFYGIINNQKSIKDIIPDNRRQIYDVKLVLEQIFDRDSIFEVQKEFADKIVVGFAKLKGNTVGFVANNPLKIGVLDCDTSDKAARFIRYCDCFNIPIITFVDVPGFLPGVEQEHQGIIRHGAKMLYAYSEATTIKLTVIMRKAYGGAYIAMCSRHLGADFVYVWPYAEIAVMGAEGAVEILYGKQMKQMTAEEKKEYIKEKETEYEQQVMNASVAVENGYVDEVIDPDSTRERLFADLCMLNDKKTILMLEKKHGNIPM